MNEKLSNKNNDLKYFKEESDLNETREEDKMTEKKDEESTNSFVTNKNNESLNSENTKSKEASTGSIWDATKEITKKISIDIVQRLSGIKAFYSVSDYFKMKSENKDDRFENKLNDRKKTKIFDDAKETYDLLTEGSLIKDELKIQLDEYFKDASPEEREEEIKEVLPILKESLELKEKAKEEARERYNELKTKERQKAVEAVSESLQFALLGTGMFLTGPAAFLTVVARAGVLPIKGLINQGLENKSWNPFKNFSEGAKKAVKSFDPRKWKEGEWKDGGWKEGWKEGEWKEAVGNISGAARYGFLAWLIDRGIDIEGMNIQYSGGDEYKTLFGSAKDLFIGSAEAAESRIDFAAEPQQGRSFNINETGTGGTETSLEELTSERYFRNFRNYIIEAATSIDEHKFDDLINKYIERGSEISEEQKNIIMEKIRAVGVADGKSTEGWIKAVSELDKEIGWKKTVNEVSEEIYETKADAKVGISESIAQTPEVVMGGTETSGTGEISLTNLEDKHPLNNLTEPVKNIAEAHAEEFAGTGTGEPVEEPRVIEADERAALEAQALEVDTEEAEAAQIADIEVVAGSNLTKAIQDFLTNPDNNIVGVKEMSEHQLNNLTANIINGIEKNPGVFGITDVDNIQAGQKIDANELLQIISDGKVNGTDNLIERALQVDRDMPVYTYEDQANQAESVDAAQSAENSSGSDLIENSIESSSINDSPVNNDSISNQMENEYAPKYTIDEGTNFNTPEHSPYPYYSDDLENFPISTSNLIHEAAMSTSGDIAKMDMSILYKDYFGEVIKVINPDGLVFFDNDNDPTHLPRFGISNIGNEIRVYEFDDNGNPKDEIKHSFLKSGDGLHKAILEVKEEMQPPREAIKQTNR